MSIGKMFNRLRQITNTEWGVWILWIPPSVLAYASDATDNPMYGYVGAILFAAFLFCDAVASYIERAIAREMAKMKTKRTS